MMNNVLVVGLMVLNFTLAAPRSDLSRQVRHTRRRDASCGEDQYLHDGKCCVNCPAGTHVKAACTSTGKPGTCEECDHGRTFTENRHGLQKCLKCTQCHSDQDVLRPCTITQNTECQCKVGRFCNSEQACEVCKKCSRCEQDEVEVSGCTPTSNTVCEKRNSGVIAGVVGVTLTLVALVILVIACIKWKLWKKCNAGQRSNHCEQSTVEMAGDRGEDPLQQQQLIQQGSLAVGASTSSVSDEDRGLGDSLANSACNSQTSLHGQPPPPCPTRFPSAYQPHYVVVDDQLPKVAPLNGESSLKSCFDYFEEVDVHYHNRFFRQLGIHNNVLKSKNQGLTPEDRIHELLGVWMEKMGREANMNDLLKTLVTLNQKLTAQNIMDKAICNGHYVYDKESSLSAGELCES